jgi:hypothetical protein
MIDPELKNHLEKIESELLNTRKSSVGIWQTLWHGVVYGAGYVVGAVLIIIIAGWILNVVGVIPAFSREVTDFQTALGNIGNTVR